jgi:hypothetical protein
MRTVALARARYAEEQARGDAGKEGTSVSHQPVSAFGGKAAALWCVPALNPQSTLRSGVDDRHGESKILARASTLKKGPSGTSEADHFRRKAKDAEHAAEIAESDEAKQFYLETAKAYHAMADQAEKEGR